MLAEDPACVFSRRARFRAETSGPGGDADGKFFLGNGFIAIEIVQLDFGRGSEPEVGVFETEKIGSEFGQLARGGERCAVYDEGRENFRITVLARVHVQEKICKGAFEARTPALIDGKARAGDFGGSLEIQDSRAFANFPVRPRMKIEFRWCAPAAHFLVVSSRATDRHARVRYVGNRKQQVALPGIKHSNASVDFLDEVRSLLHFRDEVIGALFILLEPGNFLAGFIALRFAPLIEGNEFAALRSSTPRYSLRSRERRSSTNHTLAWAQSGVAGLQSARSGRQDADGRH